MLFICVYRLHLIYPVKGYFYVSELPFQYNFAQLSTCYFKGRTIAFLGTVFISIFLFVLIWPELDVNSTLQDFCAQWLLLPVTKSYIDLYFRSSFSSPGYHLRIRPKYQIRLFCNREIGE